MDSEKSKEDNTVGEHDNAHEEQEDTFHEGDLHSFFDWLKKVTVRTMALGEDGKQVCTKLTYVGDQEHDRNEEDKPMNP